MAEESLQTILDGLPAGVDKQVLGALALELSLPTLSIMCQAFLEELTDNETALRDAVKANDFSTIERIVHTTKSTAGTFGATQLHSIALEAEAAAQAADKLLIEQKTEEIIAEISQTHIRFQSIIEQMGTE